mmetsp:Transcript_173739/g.556822  ORF Transcript_173739/g.556822 Transcript_173739/m.556822 type:complete len:228 (+) Transcript_173739:432-1115(+)
MWCTAKPMSRARPRPLTSPAATARKASAALRQHRVAPHPCRSTRMLAAPPSGATPCRRASALWRTCRGQCRPSSRHASTPTSMVHAQPQFRRTSACRSPRILRQACPRLEPRGGARAWRHRLQRKPHLSHKPCKRRLLLQQPWRACWVTSCILQHSPRRDRAIDSLPEVTPPLHPMQFRRCGPHDHRGLGPGRLCSRRPINPQSLVQELQQRWVLSEFPNLGLWGMN